MTREQVGASHNAGVGALEGQLESCLSDKGNAGPLNGRALQLATQNRANRGVY